MRESLRQVALELSEEIIADFQALLFPTISEYPVYIEVLKIIEELKSGQFKEHPKILLEDLSYFSELQDKLRSLNQLLLAGVNFDQRSPTGL